MLLTKKTNFLLPCNNRDQIASERGWDGRRGWMINTNNIDLSGVGWACEGRNHTFHYFHVSRIKTSISFCGFYRFLCGFCMAGGFMNKLSASIYLEWLARLTSWFYKWASQLIMKSNDGRINRWQWGLMLKRAFKITDSAVGWNIYDSIPSQFPWHPKKHQWPLTLHTTWCEVIQRRLKLHHNQLISLRTLSQVVSLSAESVELIFE